MRREDWRGKHYSCFSNRECEYFPCHAGADPENFNCLFCYCPLYFSGRNCGGSFRYTASGIKDCTGCIKPHDPENYGYIIERFKELSAKMAERERNENKD